MHTNQSSFYGNGRRGVDKRKLSFVFMALTVLFTVGAIVCLVTKGVARSAVYHKYLKSAGAEFDQDAAENEYLRAIALYPSRAQAYADLLTVYLGSSEKETGAALSKAEYKVLATLLSANESALLRGEPAVYAEKVLFPLAEALFFNYEDDGKAQAAELLGKAAAFIADNGRKEFAEALKTVAESRVKINGGAEVDYEEYCDSLSALCGTDRVVNGGAEEVVPTCRFIIEELERGVFKGSGVDDKSLQLLRDAVKVSLMKVRDEGDEPAALLKRCDMLQFGAAEKEGDDE